MLPKTPTHRTVTRDTHEAVKLYATHTHIACTAPARGCLTNRDRCSHKALRVGRILRGEHVALDPVEGPDGRQVDLAQAES